MTVDPFGHGHDGVPLLTPGAGQIPHGGHEVRFLLTHSLEGGIVGTGNDPLEEGRHFAQKPVGVFTAPVGGADGGEGGNIGRCAAEGHGVADVQAALGMGDDVDLFAAGTDTDVLDPVRQDLGAFGNGCGGGVVAVVKGCAVLHQKVRHTAPVIEAVAVPEEKAVDQHDGILCLADLLVTALPIDPPFVFLDLDLLADDLQNVIQGNQVGQGDRAADGADDPHFQAQMDGGTVDADDAVPKAEGQHTDAQQDTENIDPWMVGNQEKGQDDLEDHRKDGADQKQR